MVTGLVHGILNAGYNYWPTILSEVKIKCLVVETPEKPLSFVVLILLAAKIVVILAHLMPATDTPRPWLTFLDHPVYDSKPIEFC